MKYFVVSDIHGFAYDLKLALTVAGYNKKNKEHMLIVLGDIFDRGEDAVGVYKFLKSIPKSRLILIKGNHEELYLDLLEKDFPQVHDFQNCTVDTFCQIAGVNPEVLNFDYYDYDQSKEHEPERQWKLIVEAVKQHEITKFIKSDIWKDYYELDNFIFVHSFIPVIEKCKLSTTITQQSPMPDWRSAATAQDWSDARWGCPWRQFQAGLFDEEINRDKILVCGHWHTSDFHSVFEGKKTRTDSSIYFGKNLIGVDGGVRGNFYFGLIHDQNVLIIEDGICYDGFGKKLEVYQADEQEEPEKPDSNGYWLSESYSAYDICLCSANCATKCARAKKTAGICTMSDFSKVCSKYKAKS